MNLTFYFVDGLSHTINVANKDTATDILNSIARNRNVTVMADDGVFVAIARNVVRIVGEPA